MRPGLILAWSEEKDRWLSANRQISFDDVRTAIEEGRILADLEHRNASKFGHQRVLVVEVGGYACAVPYVIDAQTCFLKTVYRSRVLQKRYLSEGKS